jgi:hypothetical protein
LLSLLGESDKSKQIDRACFGANSVVSGVGKRTTCHPEGGDPGAKISRSGIQLADFGATMTASSAQGYQVHAISTAGRVKMPIAPIDLLKLASQPRHVNHL